MKQIFIILTLLCGATASAQTMCEIPFTQYLDRVRGENLSYAAQKLDIPIAQANVTAARVFNDPQISLGYENNNDWDMLMGQSFSGELSKTFSPGKRSANIRLAQSELGLSEALLEDFFRNLQAEASLTYLEAMKQRQIYAVKQNSYDAVRRLASADSARYTLGKITGVDATQSRVEAEIVRSQMRGTQADLHNAYISLTSVMGRLGRDTLFVPMGRVEPARREFRLEELIALGLDNRADLVAAMQNIEVSQRALIVAKRQRNIDFDISLGVSHSTQVRNELAPAPQFTGVSAGLSIPLKFSNINRGTLRAAQMEVTRSEINYQQARLDVQTEVSKSFEQYRAFASQVETYDRGLLDQARSVVDGKIYSYNRGESSLLEVLTAQRTYDDVRVGYIETLYSCAAALVELQRSVGVTDFAMWR